MAIQHRRGAYVDFDPSKLLPGELAVVTSGDPESSSGRSLYICFVPGVVKRITSYEDFQNEMDSVKEEVRNLMAEDIAAAISSAESAAGSADVAAQKAYNAAISSEAAINKIVSDAITAIDEARKSADEAAQRAMNAAAACEGIADNTRVTALENKVSHIISLLSSVISTDPEPEATE